MFTALAIAIFVASFSTTAFILTYIRYKTLAKQMLAVAETSIKLAQEYMQLNVELSVYRTAENLMKEVLATPVKPPDGSYKQ